MLVYNHVPDFRSVEKVLPYVDRFYFIDNNSGESVRSELKTFCNAHSPCSVLLENDANLGISKAYNQAIALAMQQGAYWVHLLDHDATFDASLITRCRETWKQHAAHGVKLGMVVPIVADDPALLHRKVGIRRNDTFIDSAITSGIMTNVDVFEEIGRFNEQLFVEAADFELSKRACQKGLKVCMVCEVLICQQFEKTPNMEKTSVKIGNIMMEIRSMVRVGIGNANIYRTRLSYYTSRRRIDLYRNLRSIIKESPNMRSMALVILILDRVEEIYLKAIGELEVLGNHATQDGKE